MSSDRWEVASMFILGLIYCVGRLHLRRLLWHYCIAQNKEIFVVDYDLEWWSYSLGHLVYQICPWLVYGEFTIISWRFVLHQNYKGWGRLDVLYPLLRLVFLKSCYRVLTTGNPLYFLWKSIWKIKFPTKVALFTLTTARGS